MKILIPLITLYLILLMPWYGCREQPAGKVGRIAVARKGLSLSANSNDTVSKESLGWASHAINSIFEKEYGIAYNEVSKTFTSPNRTQNLTAVYSHNRLTLTPRAGTTENWQLQLRVNGIYAGSILQYQPSGISKAVVKGNNIRFNHTDEFTTEYINTPAGVRQNFIIHKQPENKGNIAVGLSLNEGWQIEKAKGEELHFLRNNTNGVLQKKITYHSLKAWDAQNKELEARFSVLEGDQAFIIEINTNEAEYPITVDPLSATAD